MAREGISTPNAPYLSEDPYWLPPFFPSSPASRFSSFRSTKSGAERCTRRQQTRRVDGWIGNFPPPISFLQWRCCPPPPWL
ncbi:hypothetical protein NC652_037525 [Populus alba x Populus x berolinensis]|nr:hypothetical protein NC652_037525 [Populus alba x Populus x berolinensis]